MAIQKISNAVIADNAIDSDNLISGAVNAADITDGTITTAKLADDSITNAKIAPNSVTSTEIAAGSVTYNQIADGTIITSKIADSQITPTKIDSAGSYTVGNITSKDYILQGISTDILDTAVDIFIYDTSKDSDGGEWRNRTQDTSWYNETLNTATRGSRREFPAVAMIVATSTTVTIYDGDDPAMPMWMVFTKSSDGNVHWLGGDSFASNSSDTIFALNGIIASGVTGTSAGRLVWANFVSDEGYNMVHVGKYKFNGGIGTRNDGLSWYQVTSTLALVNRSVNDVAMTVLPNAPIDAATDLPIPTIAVATAGGVSVIKDDGTVVDIVGTSQGSDAPVDSISFVGTDKILYSHRYASEVNVIPASDDSAAYYNSTAGWRGRITNDTSHVTTSQVAALGDDANNNFESIALDADNAASKSANGLSLANHFATSGDLDRAAAFITSLYNTGWMPGDIKGAWLSDTTQETVVGTELVTNGTFDSNISGWTDNSGSGSSISYSSGTMYLDGAVAYARATQAISTVIGKTYVFKADWSGLSAETYQMWAGTSSPYSSNLGAVTGTSNGTNTLNFVAASTTTYLTLYTGWNVYVDNVSCRIADADRSVNNKGLQVFGSITKTPVASGADLVAYSGFSGTNFLKQPYSSNLDFGTGDFCYMAWFKLNDINTTYGLFSRQTVGQESGNRFQIQTDSSGVLAVYNSGNIGNTSFSLTSMVGSWSLFAIYRRSGRLYASLNGRPGVNIGGDTADYNNSTADFVVAGLNLSNSTTIGYALNGYVSMVRVSATVPSDDQIKKIYEDEKFLFQEGAQSTLYGSSNAVTALAYDDSTELLHVGTSAGRSVFQGLRRVQNTTTAVSTAISANNELVAEQ